MMRPPAFKVLERRLGRHEHAAHVDGQHAVEFFERRFFKGLGDRRAGVVDQDVETAESRDRFFDGGFDGVGIGGVRLDGDGLATGAVRSP